MRSNIKIEYLVFKNKKHELMNIKINLFISIYFHLKYSFAMKFKQINVFF